MKKRLSILAILSITLAQPAFAFQPQSGTGPGWNNGTRNGGFCIGNFNTPFGRIFMPCLYFG